jgi:hypothetical protein
MICFNGVMIVLSDSVTIMLSLCAPEGRVPHLRRAGLDVGRKPG